MVLVAAWYETAVLLGPVPVAGILLGTLLGALFLAFAIAVVALSAADYVPATAVTIIATAACLAGAVALTRRREL